MFFFGDPEKSDLRIWRLLILDLFAVMILTLLFVCGIVPLYPGAAIAYPVLFAANVLVWRGSRRRRDIAVKRASAPLSLWIIAFIFTSAGIAGIVTYLRRPSMPLAVQAVISILLIVYIWFLIYCRRRSGRS